MIESVNNERVKYWTKLQDSKYQKIEKKFIVEGEHLVEEADKKGKLLEVIALIGSETSTYQNVTYVSMSVMKKITSLTNVPKIIGVAGMLDEGSIKGKVLLLDRISNPGNLGTIIRSAVAFGIDTVVLSPGSVSIYNPKVVRATEGLMFHINLIERDLEEVCLELKQNGYTIYSTDVQGGKVLGDVDFSEKSAIIMGNEGSGVQEEISKYADEFLYIKMNENCESLNVGVATSIILYELSKK